VSLPNYHTCVHIVIDGRRARPSCRGACCDWSTWDYHDHVCRSCHMCHIESYADRLFFDTSRTLHVPVGPIDLPVNGSAFSLATIRGTIRPLPPSRGLSRRPQHRVAWKDSPRYQRRDAGAS
jgi:hypothetical protein